MCDDDIDAVFAPLVVAVCEPNGTSLRWNSVASTAHTPNAKHREPSDLRRSTTVVRVVVVVVVVEDEWPRKNLTQGSATHPGASQPASQPGLSASVIVSW